MKRGFTLIELLVAIGILAIVLSFAGTIFRVSIDSYHTAVANAEIMRKLQAIVEQLDADFRGLRKDGEIFVVWVASRTDPTADPRDPNSYERFDRIMFFADGDFHSYRDRPKVIRGNLARICYMLARKGDLKAQDLRPQERVLARTQHIITADSQLSWFLDPNAFSDVQWYQWNNFYEYDKLTMEQWLKIPPEQKQDVLSVIMDVTVGGSKVDPKFRGAHVDRNDPNTLHMLLCEGVGQFAVQGFYERPGGAGQWRWIPQVDPAGNGLDPMNPSNAVNADEDFYFIPGDPNTPGVLYPYRELEPGVGYGGVVLKSFPFYPAQNVRWSNFPRIPGLGRALKFTFTLYDSKGVLPHGRTFTHIVYLDD